MITVESVPRPNGIPTSVTLNASGTCIKFVLIDGKLKEAMRYKDSQIFERAGFSITKREYAKLTKQALAILRGK